MELHLSCTNPSIWSHECLIFISKSLYLERQTLYWNMSHLLIFFLVDIDLWITMCGKTLVPLTQLSWQLMAWGWQSSGHQQPSYWPIVPQYICAWHFTGVKMYLDRIVFHWNHHWKEDVALVAITGITMLVPYLSVKSLLLFWRSDTHGFHLLVTWPHDRVPE